MCQKNNANLKSVKYRFYKIQNNLSLIKEEYDLEKKNTVYNILD